MVVSIIIMLAGESAGDAPAGPEQARWALLRRTPWGAAGLLRVDRSGSEVQSSSSSSSSLPLVAQHRINSRPC